MTRTEHTQESRQLEAEGMDWLDYFIAGLLLGCILIAAVAGHAVVSAAL